MSVPVTFPAGLAQPLLPNTLLPSDDGGREPTLRDVVTMMHVLQQQQQALQVQLNQIFLMFHQQVANHRDILSSSSKHTTPSTTAAASPNAATKGTVTDDAKRIYCDSCTSTAADRADVEVPTPNPVVTTVASSSRPPSRGAPELAGSTSAAATATTTYAPPCAIPQFTVRRISPPRGGAPTTPPQQPSPTVVSISPVQYHVLRIPSPALPPPQSSNNNNENYRSHSLDGGPQVVGDSHRSRSSGSFHYSSSGSGKNKLLGDSPFHSDAPLPQSHRTDLYEGLHVPPPAAPTQQRLNYESGAFEDAMRSHRSNSSGSKVPKTRKSTKKSSSSGAYHQEDDGGESTDVLPLYPSQKSTNSRQTAPPYTTVPSSRSRGGKGHGIADYSDSYLSEDSKLYIQSIGLHLK